MGVGVVAVVEVVHVAFGQAAGEDRVLGVAVRVAVSVSVPGGPRADVDAVVLVIDQLVAVVVHAVTDLLCIRVDQRIGVVAVLRVVDVAIRGLAGLDGAVWITVAVVVAVGVVGVPRPFVDLAVAVVVDLVAVLFCTRVHFGIAVVAVLVTGESVAVGVGILDARLRLEAVVRRRTAHGDEGGQAEEGPEANRHSKPRVHEIEWTWRWTTGIDYSGCGP